MRRRMLWLCVVAGLVAAAAPRAPADERILDYHSDITVDKDGWLTVMETIRVRCERREIKRGIYRDFPVLYVGRDRSRVIVPFEVVRVRRDGKPEAHHTESQSDFTRVYMGDKGVLLKPGVYTYELTYRTGRQIGFFAKFDELYFNITGNEWAFPIDKCSATVTLPPGVPADKIHHEAYTGPKGAKGKDYRSSVDQAGRTSFQATRPLAKAEGLTIVVNWPKGFVVEPTAGEKLRYLLRDNGMVLAGLVGLIVVTVYYVTVWSCVGRDPATGIIIPLFDPPAGMDAAAVRYVLRMGFDKACFTAAVLGLAVKRYLTIADDDGDYSLVKEAGASDEGLTRGEKKVAHRLLGSRKSIELDNTHHATFSKAMVGLKQVLAEEYRGRYFFANVKWFLPGVAGSVATIVGIGLVAALSEGRPEVAFLCVWLSFWSVGVFFLARQVIVSWLAVRSGQGVGRLASFGGALFITLFAVPFVAAEIGVFGFLIWRSSVWLVPVLALLAGANVWFHHLLKRPTVEGRKVMDEIEGLRMYLATAERETTYAARPPTKTPELFEKLLPYAVALGVANAWSGKFADVLERAGAEGRYQPGWYRGAAWGALGAVAFSSSFGGSFSSSLSSASMAPGSHSGSGGGGSSGGGGGGGGGGGW